MTDVINKYNLARGVIGQWANKIDLEVHTRAKMMESKFKLVLSLDVNPSEESQVYCNFLLMC